MIYELDVVVRSFIRASSLYFGKEEEDELNGLPTQFENDDARR